MGTIINALAIVMGTLVGMIFKKRLPKDLQKPILMVMGIAITGLSLGWFMSDFLILDNGSIATQNELLVIISLVIGTIIGETLDIDGKLRRFASNLESRYQLPPIAQGFISGTMIFCIGALAILGAIQDGIHGDISILGIKSVLDFITSMMLASVFGIGVAFAAVSVLIYQGLITLGAMALGMFLTDPMIVGMSMVGNLMLVAMGINFMELKKEPFKVANMLPGLLVPLVYFFIMGLF